MNMMPDDQNKPADPMGMPANAPAAPAEPTTAPEMPGQAPTGMPSAENVTINEPGSTQVVDPTIVVDENGEQKPEDGGNQGAPTA